MTIVAKIRYSTTDLVFDGTGAWSILNWNAKTSRDGEDVVETMTLRVLSATDDLLATQIQLFDDLILRANRYRENPSYETPVWLHVKRFSETGERRALIKHLGYEPISSEFNAEAVAHAVRLQVEIVRGGYWEDPTGITFPELSVTSGACIEHIYTPVNSIEGDVDARIGTLYFRSASELDRLWIGVHNSATTTTCVWECEDGTNTGVSADDATSEPITASPVDRLLLVEDCEDAWNELVDADVVSTSETTIIKAGTASAKLAVGAAVAAGDILATEAIASLDLSVTRAIKYWIRSSVATAAGDLALLLDETANCASPSETLAVPALTANTWKEVTVSLTAAAADLNAIISVGMQCVVDKGTHDLYIDDIQAIKNGVFVTGTPTGSDTWEKYFTLTLKDVFGAGSESKGYGVYLWLLRCKVAAANAFDIQLRWGYSGMADAEYVKGTTLEITNANWDYHEMGIAENPARNLKIFPTSIWTTALDKAWAVQVWARRTTGASTIKFDCLCPIRVDYGMLKISDAGDGASTDILLGQSPEGTWQALSYNTGDSKFSRYPIVNAHAFGLPPGGGRMNIVFARSDQSVLTDTFLILDSALLKFFECWRSLRGSE